MSVVADQIAGHMCSGNDKIELDLDVNMMHDGVLVFWCPAVATLSPGQSL